MEESHTLGVAALLASPYRVQMGNPLWLRGRSNALEPCDGRKTEVLFQRRLRNQVKNNQSARNGRPG